MSADHDHAVEKKLLRVASADLIRSDRWAEPLIARLATEFWRLSRRVEPTADADALRSIAVYLERITDVLAEHKVKAVDHVGDPYDPGLQVEVLHQREGEGTLVILETVTPTITLDGRVLQHGQVIIGAWEAEEDQDR